MSNKFINIFMKTFSYNLICDSIFYGAETWTLWKIDKKCLESFEMWRWRRMEKISWTDRVRNEESRRIEKFYILLTEGRLTGLVQFSAGTGFETTLLKTEGRIEMSGRQGIRRKQLLDSLKKTSGYRILKETALDRAPWRTRYGPVARLQNSRNE